MASNNTLQRLLFATALAKKLMAEHGLTEDGWTFEIANTKNALGTCHHKSKCIEFSKYFLESSDEEIRDTILHEIAHALVGPNHGHNWEWKYQARMIGANPSRTSHSYVTSAKPLYILRCSACNKKVGERFRLKKALDNYTTKCCGAEIKYMITTAHPDHSSNQK